MPTYSVEYERTVRYRRLYDTADSTEARAQFWQDHLEGRLGREGGIPTDVKVIKVDPT